MKELYATLLSVVQSVSAFGMEIKPWQYPQRRVCTMAPLVDAGDHNGTLDVV
jgi:hypothetical protein